MLALQYFITFLALNAGNLLFNFIEDKGLSINDIESAFDYGAAIVSCYVLRKYG